MLLGHANDLNGIIVPCGQPTGLPKWEFVGTAPGTLAGADVS
jgi:hypothetical protein